MALRLPRWAHALPLRLAVATVLAGVAVAALAYYASPRYTDVGYRPEQPVPYSHRLHAGELGIDCLYCHASVDRAPAAVIPPTRVCMNCHHVVQRESEALAPVRESAAKNRPLAWVRVHDLPGFTAFDHRPHLRAGVGCASCHGRIDTMEVVAQAEPLSMTWCLDCHRDPDLHLRPADELTTMDWAPPKDQAEFAALVKAEKRLAPPIDDCTGCHR